VRIPVQEEGEVTSLHVVLPAERVARPLGSRDAPIDAAEGLPDPELVGSWPPAQRRACDGPAPAGMVCVPGGAFWMGDASQVGAEGDQRRLVGLSPFFVDATEVTPLEYKNVGSEWRVTDPYVEGAPLCTIAQGVAVPPGQGRRAANCLRHLAAEVHCNVRGAMLPTEAQLEYLMGGLRSARFPWGGDLPGCEDAVFARAQESGGPEAACYSPGELEGPHRPASGARDVLVLPSGTVFDLAGNLAEWTFDAWNRQDEACWGVGVYQDPFCDEASRDGDGLVVVRGGDWTEPPTLAHAARRRRVDAAEYDYTVGFRCAMPAAR
jgi:sulfatase modifying factor 1